VAAHRSNSSTAAARGGNLAALEHLAGAVPAPYPGFIEPCRPVLRDRPPTRGEWLQEIKHDGYRVQAHLLASGPALYTRRGYDWSARFSSIAEDLKSLAASQAILDGEVVVQNQRGLSDFHELQSDLSAGRTDRLLYLVFDVLYVDGIDLRQSALIERREVLARLLASCAAETRIRLSEYLEADPAAVFQQACAMNLEGIVSKQPDSPYRSGEQDSWIKVKCVKSDTFPIVAFVEKLGAAPRRIASLYLGRREGDKLLYAGKAQTGFKQATLYELRERLDPYIRKTSPLSVPVKKPKATWVEPVVQAEIEYSALTADKLLRAPVFKGIRDDLAEEASARTQRQEIESRRVRVPRENILQLLPDAVVPAKEALARYWNSVATEALKYIARRPLKLVRHTHDTTFYHMGPLPPVPGSVHQLQIEKRAGGTGVRLWVDDFEGLLGLVAIGAVELHVWNSTVDDLEHPDQMVFDLDPGPGVPFGFVRESALALRELLQSEGLSSWPKLTGGKGVHVMVPLEPKSMSHDEAHRYSRTLAGKLAATQPARYTTAAAAGERKKRLFVDFLRNGRGTTAVATYSPRARPRFPIAAPTTWRALAEGIRPDAYTMMQPPATTAPASKRSSPRRKRTVPARRRSL
jgi:bifunctional non-homologous end joining protein LigD